MGWPRARAEFLPDPFLSLFLPIATHLCKNHALALGRPGFVGRAGRAQPHWCPRFGVPGSQRERGGLVVCVQNAQWYVPLGYKHGDECGFLIFNGFFLQKGFEYAYRDSTSELTTALEIEEGRVG